MNSCRIISGLIAFSALVSPASAQQKKAASSQEKLIANPESNTFSIIEILFRQVRNKGAEQADRADSLKRLESMLTKFLKDYPKSSKGTYAHYMLYETYSAQKNTKKAEAELKTLAAMRPSVKPDNFVAFAAYNLAVRQFSALEAGAESAKDYDAVIDGFSVVEQYSSDSKLVYDAKYRRAQAYMMKGKLQTSNAEQLNSYTTASDIFASLDHDESKLPAHIKEILPYAYAQLKMTIGGNNNLKSARELYIKFLKSEKGTPKQTVQIMWSIAKISDKLGDVEQAVEYYDKVIKASDDEKYLSDAHLGIITSLYHAKRFDALFEKFPPEGNHAEYLKKIKDASARTLCACAIGQVYIDKEQNYRDAEKLFALAASYNTGTVQGADAGYRRIMCLSRLKNEGSADLSRPAEEYLKTYGSSQDAKIAERVNLVRIIYADTLREGQEDKALAQYLKIDTDKLSGTLQIDTEFKKIWSVYKAWSKNGEHKDLLEKLLNDFLSKRAKSDYCADVLSMKGAVLAASNLADEALAEYEKVITRYPGRSIYPVCVQRAARVCWDRTPRDNDRAKKYYELLIQISEPNMSEDAAASQVPHHEINEYAKAEANFRLALIHYEWKEIEQAIGYYQSAIKHNPEYKQDVSLRLIYCYFMRRNENSQRALDAIRAFKKDYPELYAALPKSMPAWSGCVWCMNADNKLENYALAVEFLNDALEWKTETAADGQQKTVPVAGASEWFYLAQSCLETAQFESKDKFVGGLDAIEYYLAGEKDTFRKAEGLKMKAMMLNGVQKYQEALDVCRTALGLGVTGPVADALRVVAGDSYYLQGNYEEAAKMYCMAAILHDGNRDFYREAVYKASVALKKNKKNSESRDYEAKLKKVLKELNIPENNPLQGLPPSSGRHVRND